MILASPLPNVLPYGFGRRMGIARTVLRGTSPLSTRLNEACACACLATNGTVVPQLSRHVISTPKGLRWNRTLDLSVETVSTRLAVPNTTLPMESTHRTHCLRCSCVRAIQSYPHCGIPHSLENSKYSRPWIPRIPYTSDRRQMFWICRIEAFLRSLSNRPCIFYLGSKGFP